MIGIVNYGSGNVQAIANIYNRVNIPFKIICNYEQMKKADKLILPGVGAFDATMKVLNNSGLREALDEQVLVSGKPVLGICVGMQILSKGSDEGESGGLGWIDGMVKKFDLTKIHEKPYLPHMGWNSISPLVNHDLFKGVDNELGFYFVHSYYFETENNVNALCNTYYGGYFSSAVYKNQIFGVQFHPEKSHSNGIKLLSNFAKM
jgi:glutamine amidotransferase